MPFLIGGVLPLEEFTFFVITCTLLTFGVTLLLAEESHVRFAAIRRRLTSRRRAQVKRAEDQDKGTTDYTNLIEEGIRRLGRLGRFSKKKRI